MFKLVAWDFFGKIANQVIAFAVSIVLARMIHPSEFGIIGIALALVGFSTIFYDFGLKASIIQAEEITPKQLSTIFYLNLGGGLILFLLCFTFSKIIERFYQINGLANVIIAIGSLLVINAMASLPIGLLSRKLQFKRMAVVNFIAAAVAGAVAVIMAYNNWGVWSLIANTLINAIIVLIGVFVLSKWTPSWVFDLKSIKPLWRFGSTVFGIEVLENIFTRLDVFLIGKLFQPAILGFYTRAQSLDSMVKQFSAGSLINVVFPYFSRIKNDVTRVKDYYKQCLHIIGFISLLLTGLMYVIAVDLFHFLFTEKWVAAGKLFQIMALSGFVYPLSALMVNVILSSGKTRTIIPLEITKKFILLPVFIFGFYGGMQTFLLGLVIAYWIILVVNAWFLRSVLTVTVGEQLSIVGRYLLIAAFAALVTYFVARQFQLLPLIGLTVKAAIFVILYSTANFLSKTSGSFLIASKALTLVKNRGLAKTI